MKMTIQAGVPEGTYPAIFRGCETTTTALGDGVRWNFSIKGGQFDGQGVSSVSSDRPTMKNRAGRIVAGMIGQPLTPAMQIDTSDFIGRTFLVIVRRSDNGGTFVESVAALPTA
jgi:hypothetical protein